MKTYKKETTLSILREIRGHSSVQTKLLQEIYKQMLNPWVGKNTEDKTRVKILNLIEALPDMFPEIASDDYDRGYRACKEELIDIIK
jgi:hypothetical protein